MKGEDEKMKYELPKGFLANGMHAGLKKKRKDLALFYSLNPAKCAAVFTRNRSKAAPVIVCQEKLKKNKGAQAILVNSGNANCMTGKRGVSDARKSAREVAKALNISEDLVLVSSTGVIGVPMNMKPLLAAVPELISGLSSDGVMRATEAIMTTDVFAKIYSVKFKCGGKEIKMIGVTKGAGMIKPNMATMLCYIFTDAAISDKALKKALIECNEESFNAISVDGDMSTNDTVIVLANGEAINPVIPDSGKEYKNFAGKLKKVMLELAKMIVRDGEGATKLVKVKVIGAKSAEEARSAVEKISNSLLLKCAIHGGDPNWGRVAAALGASGIEFDPDGIEIIMDGVTFYKNGKSVADFRTKKDVFKGKDAEIEVRLNEGKYEATMYTCDLSKKYIYINSFYTT
ncbi:MAG: bifunctional glutamate N-acetyltransferase/amino-acid acetyltransferase ArgJ [Candidatus Omnitrophica bacterium]|nr:bifunctional glutamate N-acetyltransferase/amino-acid acetyltransferase ArgJ [Candidatus Omnitrophota bacterium]